MEILCVEPGERNGHVRRVVVAMTGEEFHALARTRAGLSPYSGQKLDITPSLEAAIRAQKAEQELRNVVWALQSQAKQIEQVVESVKGLRDLTAETKPPEG